MRQPSDYEYAADDPFGNMRPSGRRHTGSDWTAPLGSPVYAVASGEIYAIGSNPGNGIYIGQSLPDGKTWSYIHLQEVIVNTGYVNEGDVIAYSGNSGTNSRGPHLHSSCAADGNPLVYLGLGKLIDPYEYLTNTPPTPPIGEENMAQGAFYRANPAIYWQEKPNTPFIPLSIWTWSAYAAQGNRYIEIPKTELDALIKKYGTQPTPNP
jgi:murein DD-endopeptidase MepM/ murein hydrolase activator NlpD